MMTATINSTTTIGTMITDNDAEYDNPGMMLLLTLLQFVDITNTCNSDCE